MIPELPIYKQRRARVNVQRIIDLNHYDDAADVPGDTQASAPTDVSESMDKKKIERGRVLEVERISVNHGSDLESVALLEVNCDFVLCSLAITVFANA